MKDNDFKAEAYEAQRLAEQKWHEYAVQLPLGSDRIQAFEIYENIRTSIMVPK